jgi:hypothetical protein
MNILDRSIGFDILYLTKGVFGLVVTVKKTVVDYEL